MLSVVKVHLGYITTDIIAYSEEALRWCPMYTYLSLECE